MSGDLFDFHKWRAATEHPVGREVREAAKHPTLQRKPPYTEKYAAPNLDSAEVEKACSKGMVHVFLH